MASLDFTPDADPESTCVDGYIGRTTAGTSWSDIRTGAGTGSSATATVIYVLQLGYTGYWTQMDRGVILFDISAIESGATINSASVKIYVTGITDDFAESNSIDLVTSNPASDTAIANTDYDYTDFGTTAFASWADTTSTGQYTSKSLNASGITAIQNSLDSDKIVRFGLRTDDDRANAEPTGYGGPGQERFEFDIQSADAANPPTLTVVYTPLPGGAPMVMSTGAVSLG